MSAKMCIVSVGVGQWYPQGVARLERSLIHHGWGGCLHMHTSYPEGCPTHQEQPYGFKLWAIANAHSEGYDQVLWLDASAWAIANPLPIFHRMDSEGHYFWTAGQNCAQWTKDRTLAYFGVTREEARQMPMLYALVMGFDFRHPRTQRFFDRWQEALEAGEFIGSWKREEGDTEEEDFLGHRHDQSCASIIAVQEGMAYDMTMDTCRTYEENAPDSVKLFFQGM